MYWLIVCPVLKPLCRMFSSIPFSFLAVEVLQSQDCIVFLCPTVLSGYQGEVLAVGANAPPPFLRPTVCPYFGSSDWPRQRSCNITGSGTSHYAPIGAGSMSR